MIAESETTLVVRPMTLEDIPQVLQLYDQPPACGDAWLRKALANPVPGCCVAVETQSHKERHADRVCGAAELLVETIDGATESLTCVAIRLLRGSPRAMRKILDEAWRRTVGRGSFAAAVISEYDDAARRVLVEAGFCGELMDDARYLFVRARA